MLPEVDGFVESTNSLALRILTSRRPNFSQGLPLPIYKDLDTPVCRITAIGDPEGNVLMFGAKKHGVAVTVARHFIAIYDPELDGEVTGTNDRGWLERHTETKMLILAQATRSLGELGIYSGMDLIHTEE